MCEEKIYVIKLFNHLHLKFHQTSTLTRESLFALISILLPTVDMAECASTLLGYNV